MKKAAIYNLGCKVNAYEAEAMSELLEKAGYEIVPFGKEADVFIINTCTVTNIADRKSRQIMHRARKLNPDAVIAAAGCYVDTHAEKDPQIDLVLGNKEKKEIVSILQAYFEKDGQPFSDELRESNGASCGSEEPVRISQMAEHTRAFVKIQDGCDSFCSYCVIPFARGRVCSRAREEVIREVTELAESGYREVVLTGIQISTYGTDFPEGRTGSEELLDLMRELERIESLSRIRLGSLEPRVITPAFVRGAAELSKFCPHFHLSLQSGCDRTLAAMNRHYSTEEFFAVTERIREVWPDAALTTDVIVGFPQEAEEDFADSYAFVDRVRFFETHIFPYSRRAGTKADRMDGQIPSAVKEERAARMIELGNRNREIFLARFPGKKVEILPEETCEYDGAKWNTGHSREYLRCLLPLSEKVRIGEPVAAEVLRAENGRLICIPCENRL